MNQFQAYQMFNALRAHFQGKFDFIKYQGKMKVSPQSLQLRKDQYQFAKLAKHPDAKGLCIANFIIHQDYWINDIVGEEGAQNYAGWKKRQESLTYEIQQNISKLDPDFDKNFEVSDNEHPLLYKMWNRGDVCTEFMIVLDSLVRFTPVWNKKMKGDPIWDQAYLIFRRYAPFVSFDKEKMKKLFVERLT
jgi:hypothetical protein